MEKLPNTEVNKTDQDKRVNEESSEKAEDKVKKRSEKTKEASSKSNKKLKNSKAVEKLTLLDSFSTGENEDDDIEDDDLKYCPGEDNKVNLNVIDDWDEKGLTETNDDYKNVKELNANKDDAYEEEKSNDEAGDLENSGMPVITNCVSITTLDNSDLRKNETIDATNESIFKIESGSEIEDADEKKVEEEEANDTNSVVDDVINEGVTVTKESDLTLKLSESDENDTSKTQEKQEDEMDKMEVDVEEQASDNDTPNLAILDVRTVCDEDQLSESEEKVENEDTRGEIHESSETQSDKNNKKTTENVTDSNAEVITTVVENCDGKTNTKNRGNATKNLKSSNASLAKRLQGKNCLVCDKVKSCKYQVLMLGITKYLCDDVCFNTFRSKARPPNKTGSSSTNESNNENRPVTRSITAPKDVCNVCRKDIKNGMGLLPGIGENKPLCSEECMKIYQAEQGLKRACAQCGKHIQSRTKCLTWEAMEFCNEMCLGNYQMYLGSHCAFCNKAVQQTYIGKYCVRFGVDIKQFCSNSCLEEFKSGLKVCSYCQKDISGGPDGFLAPVGDKGQFKEFCTQSCMEKFELMGSASSKPSFKKCSMCKNISSVNVEVNFEGKEHKLCSESCIAAFRYANKINTSICDTCHKFFDLDISKQMTIQFEGSSKRFCSKACMNVFVLYHRKVVPCSWCRVKKYNFDMIERVDSNNHVQLFCSLNCLSLFRVSLNATSSRRVQCDYCRQVKPAQFHLTMSDASIRNFCTLNCAMQFQGQFTSVAPVITAVTSSTSESTTTSISAGSTKTTTVLAAGTPIISSVVSLAPASSTQSTTLPSSSQTPKTVFVMSAAGAGGSSAPNVTVSKPFVMKSSSSTQTSSPSVTQQVVIKPPVTKTIKNKAITCRPLMQTKGVSCKPHPCHKSVQTDEVKQNPIFIPVPVPIYVPVPMRMYTTPTPVPLPFPIPIPVPIFIPTTKNSAHGIFKQIKEIQQKIPDNPFEADLILMAEMVAEDSSSKDKKPKPKAIKNEPANLDGSEGESFGTENAPPEACQNPTAFGDDVLQMALRMAENVDLEVALSSTGTLSHNNQSTGENGGDECLGGRQLRSVNKGKRTTSRGRGRGRKRAKTEDPVENSMPASPVLPSTLTSAYGLHTALTPQVESNCVLKFSYGVNAWKHWVIQKNNQLEKATASHRKLKLFKTDLLQLSAEELCFSLCLFVKEVRKPNSEEYAPDSIYYLCLGIQQYLFENGRIDNIFSDAYYEKFTISLNEVLQRYELNLSHDASTGLFLSRIEEEILWESKQLGAHSPHVLLNTLMYFNTKYFLLKTVEDHLQLSFSHILKHWKKTPGGKTAGSGGVGCRNVLLRYYPSSQGKESNRRKKDSAPAFEQVENVENPLRCPVKLYEFYLSKCSPESIKSRNDVFYLYPERSCVPDSPVWYSTMPLGRESIAKMLQRIRMVREVGEAIMAAS